eukprot:8334042-Pyramimonas_sp.AAC.1
MGADLRGRGPHAIRALGTCAGPRTLRHRGHPEPVLGPRQAMGNSLGLQRIRDWPGGAVAPPSRQPRARLPTSRARRASSIPGLAPA